jgi:peptidyl-dipeptidase A
MILGFDCDFISIVFALTLYKNFRMITCGSKNFYDIYVILHEMGHIQYYMQSKHLPTIYQDGNILVQESIGDAMYLGLLTPVHLNRLGLNPDKNIFQPKFRNNFDLYILMKLAFSKIPLIPFQYIFDKFRWDLFSGEVKFQESNDFYWTLVEKYQKIKPPTRRFDRHNLFDMGAYFHLADNTPYNPV